MISLARTALLSATIVAAGSLADIDHVVLFMQENRAFDHVRHLFIIFYKH